MGAARRPRPGISVDTEARASGDGCKDSTPLCLAENPTRSRGISYVARPHQFQAAQPVALTYHAKRVLVKPDGFVRLYEHTDHEQFEHFFFLEVDRSTEHHETLALRCFGYQDYYRRGGLSVRYGHSPEEYKDFPFRVLLVLQNEKRRNNLAEWLLKNNPPVRTTTWLTTFSEITARPARGDLATTRRPYGNRERYRMDPRRPRTSAYRRDPAREAMVAAEIQKLRLLEYTPVYKWLRPCASLDILTYIMLCLISLCYNSYTC